jgi:hypothetical protein
VSPSSAARSARGLSFRAKLVLGVCGLVLLTGAVVLWLAHRSAKASTEVLTGSVFREVSGRAVTHTRAFVLRAAPVVESLAQLADKGLAVDDSEHLAPQLLAVLKANPGLSWVSYSDESGRFTGANRTPDGRLLINQSQLVNGKTKLLEYEPLPDSTRRIGKAATTASTMTHGSAHSTKARRKRIGSSGCRPTFSSGSGYPESPARFR